MCALVYSELVFMLSVSGKPSLGGVQGEEGGGRGEKWGEIKQPKRIHWLERGKWLVWLSGRCFCCVRGSLMVEISLQPPSKIMNMFSSPRAGKHTRTHSKGCTMMEEIIISNYWEVALTFGGSEFDSGAILRRQICPFDLRGKSSVQKHTSEGSQRHNLQ